MPLNRVFKSTVTFGAGPGHFFYKSKKTAETGFNGLVYNCSLILGLEKKPTKYKPCLPQPDTICRQARFQKQPGKRPY